VSTVGRHAAADGASAHPIVAAALASRLAEAGGVRSADGARAAGESPVGWPGPPTPEGGGLGWPADADTDTDVAVPAGAPAEASVLRRSWRRLFGAGRVA
jgi:hypothetical protein